MTFDELKDALNNLRVPGDSEVYICLPDAEITVALPYLVRAEPAGAPRDAYVVRIYGEEPEVEAVALLRAIWHCEGADKWPDPVEFRRRVEALVGPPPPSQYTNVPATDTGSGCGGGDLWRLWPKSERNKP